MTDTQLDLPVSVDDEIDPTLTSHERCELAYQRALAGRAPTPETMVEWNGSKWLGDAPDSVEELIAVLEQHALSAHWHKSQGYVLGGRWATERVPECYARFTHHFSGNFDDVSHAFSVWTNDPGVARELGEAIAASIARERSARP